MPYLCGVVAFRKRLNEEKYKEEIIKFIKEERDEAYLRAVYTFAKNYPRSKKEEKE